MNCKIKNKIGVLTVFVLQGSLLLAVIEGERVVKDQPVATNKLDMSNEELLAIADQSAHSIMQARAITGEKIEDAKKRVVVAKSAPIGKQIVDRALVLLKEQGMSVFGSKLQVQIDSMGKSYLQKNGSPILRFYLKDANKVPNDQQLKNKGFETFFDFVYCPDRNFGIHYESGFEPETYVYQDRVDNDGGKNPIINAPIKYEAEESSSLRKDLAAVAPVASEAASSDLVAPDNNFDSISAISPKGQSGEIKETVHVSSQNFLDRAKAELAERALQAQNARGFTAKSLPAEASFGGEQDSIVSNNETKETVVNQDAIKINKIRVGLVLKDIDTMLGRSKVEESEVEESDIKKEGVSIFKPGDAIYDKTNGLYAFETKDQPVIRWYFKMPSEKTARTVKYADLLYADKEGNTVNNFAMIYNTRDKSAVLPQSDGKFVVQVYKNRVGKDGAQGISEKYIVSEDGTTLSQSSLSDEALNESDSKVRSFEQKSGNQKQVIVPLPRPKGKVYNSDTRINLVLKDIDTMLGRSKIEESDIKKEGVSIFKPAGAIYDKANGLYFFETKDQPVIRWYFKMPFWKTARTVKYADLLYVDKKGNTVNNFVTIYNTRDKSAVLPKSDGTFVVGVYKNSEKYIVSEDGKKLQSFVDRSSLSDEALNANDSKVRSFERKSGNQKQGIVALPRPTGKVYNSDPLQTNVAAIQVV